MTTPISPPSVEILMIKMEHVVQSIESMRTDLKEHNSALQRLPLVEQSINQLDGKMTRAFKEVSEVRTQNSNNTEAITGAKVAYRILAGATTFAASALVMFSGWAWGQLDSLKAQDNRLSDRIKVLEIRYEAAEKINDKMKDKG